MNITKVQFLKDLETKVNQHISNEEREYVFKKLTSFLKDNDAEVTYYEEVVRKYAIDSKWYDTDIKCTGVRELVSCFVTYEGSEKGEKYWRALNKKWQDYIDNTPDLLKLD